MPASVMAVGIFNWTIAKIFDLMTSLWLLVCTWACTFLGLKVGAFLVKPARHSPNSALSSTSDSASKVDFKLLVLGGTGFVGRELVKRARQKGYSVVSISRRGKLVGETDQSVTWVSGDASQVKTLQAVIDDFGPFDGCVHAVGLLLDAESGLSALNKYASGSGSSPTSESTYDRVTRQTGK
jgi:NAD dependent epimerase/dehydratase family